MKARAAVTALFYALAALQVSSHFATRGGVAGRVLSLSACPLLQFNPEEHVLGRSLRVSVKITNIGIHDFDHATVKMDFPGDAIDVRKASVFPPMKGDDRAMAESSFYWLNINIAVGKTRKFTLWAQTQDCKFSSSMYFKASLYLTDAQGNPRCLVNSNAFGEGNGTTKARSSRFSSGKNSKTCAPTPAPTVTPDVPYSVYAAGQKCLEGSTTTPAGKDQNIQTPSQCWEYCTFYGTSPLPYYFNWDVTTKDCYCVGQTCTLIYAPDYLVFLVNEAATRAPTLTPTIRPTITGETFSPTVAPTLSPTSTPTVVPTAFTSTPTTTPTTRPTSTPTTRPTTTPTSIPTTFPTQAPTRACSFGEYRDPVTGACLPCAPGTYWNQSSETTACLVCPTDQTSLQGATRCYIPCPLNAALNTTDLTCVPVPESLQNITIQGNVSVNLNTSDVYIVEEPNKFQDTVARADNTSNLNTTDPNVAIVIALSPGAYPVTDTTVVRVPLIIVADAALVTERRRLQTATRAVISAAPGARHFTVESTSLIADGVVLRGSLTGAYSGGVEFVGTAPVGQFIRTTFRSCRWAGNGGGVLLSGTAAQCSADSTCIFADNTALAGGAIYADTGSTLTISDTVQFTNNSAPRTSSTSGGGGGIYLRNALLNLGSNVAFSANINDDITTLASTITCLTASYPSSCSGGCTGSYDIPGSCPFCSSPTSGSVCNTCPRGAYGGAEAELPCELCPYGQTTIYPPSSTSSADCIPITEAPTLVPTVFPTLTPSSPPTVSPTLAPSLLPTLAPSSRPTVPPTSAPSLSPTTASPSQRPTQRPTSQYPTVRDVNVTSLNTDSFPPPDVWATTPSTYNALQSISPAPSPYSCALRQETVNDPSKATTGIYWEQSGMFNGMLFKNFVLGGFQLFYNYFVLLTPAGQQSIYAPDIRIQTRSPLTGRYADFVWNPFNNQGSQGPVAYQTWKGNNITQTTGSDGSWPVGPTGGEGWTCTLGCYLPVNSTENAANTSRDLLTYVNALVDQDENSQAYVSINSAIITGIQVVLGPEEPNSISYTHDVSVQSGAFNWAWAFNC